MIHKLTENSPIAEGSKCPISHTPLDSALEGDLGGEELRKLKRVMATITKFYVDGTELKRSQMEHVEKQIAAMESDLLMIEAQLEALRAEPHFKDHPKQKTYLSSLEVEITALTEQRAQFLAKRVELKGFWEWSQVIVKVCGWLETCMEQYAREELGIAPKHEDGPSSTSSSASNPDSGAIHGGANLPELSDAECVEYGKGLDEITYNLQESQDFFRASIDGRLHKYHSYEKDIIEAQLAAIRKFPEESARRQYIESELLQDLEYVDANMKDDPATMRRREKMLQAHSDYFKVLKFYKERLAARTPFRSDPSREYDPKFDFNPASMLSRA